MENPLLWAVQFAAKCLLIISTTTRRQLLKTIHKFFACSAVLAALTGCGTTGLQIAEVGSYHVGGRPVTLAGLPEKELVFTPGAPPLKINPNGDFEVESLYARYTKLAAPKAKYPLLLWHGSQTCAVPKHNHATEAAFQLRARSAASRKKDPSH